MYLLKFKDGIYENDKSVKVFYNVFGQTHRDSTVGLQQLNHDESDQRQCTSIALAVNR